MRDELTHGEGSSTTAGRLPPGRHGLSRQQVAHVQRTRLLRAVVDAVGHHGYHVATIDDVVSLAGVSKKTFYVHFRNKAECFLAAYDAFAGYLLDEMATAFRTAEGDWWQRYLVHIRTYLDLLAAHPERARALLLDVLSVGSDALAKRRANLARFEAHIREIHTQARREDPSIIDLPPQVLRLLVAGADEDIRDHIAHGKTEALPALATPLTTSFAWVVTGGAAPHRP